MIAANLHDLHFSSSQIGKNSKGKNEVVVRSSFDGETFLQMKHGMFNPSNTNISSSVVATASERPNNMLMEYSSPTKGGNSAYRS